MTSRFASPALALTIAALGGIAVGLRGQADAAVIDLFDSHPQSLAHDRSAGRGPSSDTTRIEGALFPNRGLELRYGTQSLVTIGGSVLEYQIENDPASNYLGYFRVFYHTGGSPTVDLLDDGADRFLFLFDAGMSFLRGQFPLRLLVEDIHDRREIVPIAGVPELFASGNGPHKLEVPFSSFEQTDFTQVIGLSLEGFRITEGSSFRLSSITTVPEPSPIILLSIGSLALLLSRR